MRRVRARRAIMVAVLRVEERLVVLFCWAAERWFQWGWFDSGLFAFDSLRFFIETCDSRIGLACVRATLVLHR